MNSSVSQNDSTTFTPPNAVAGNVLAATVVLVIGVFGLTANITAIVCSLRIKSAAKQQFTTIFLSLAFGDTGVLLGYVLYVAPSIYAQTPLDSNPILSGTVSTIMMSSFYASGYSALMMAVNRFVAVWSPQRYAIMYEPRNLRRQIGACWAVAIALGILYGVPGCGIYFNPFAYIWFYPATTCGFLTDYVLDFIPNVLIFSVAATLTVATFIKLRHRRTEVSHSIVFSVAPLTPLEQLHRKRENAFLTQSCVNCSVYVTMMFLFHVVATVVTGKWAWYWLTTVSWVFAHFLNGVVYLFLMPNIRQALLEFFVTKQRTSSIALISLPLRMSLK